MSPPRARHTPRARHRVVFALAALLVPSLPIQADPPACELELRVVQDGQLAVLGAGDAVRLRGNGDTAGRALLLAGVPHGEPVAHYGPFVMNTEEELRQAVRDYQNGRMGEITRTAQTH